MQRNNHQDDEATFSQRIRRHSEIIAWQKTLVVRFRVKSDPWRVRKFGVYEALKVARCKKLGFG
jgi:hypothetical protein